MARIGTPLPYGTTTCGYQTSVGSEPCNEPSTWHLIDRTRHTLQTCEEHLDIASALAVDRHAFGAVCGMPGTIWQCTDGNGEGFCFWPPAEEAITVELAGKVGAA